MSSGNEDLDEWMTKLDNLQKALKSCSSSRPRTSRQSGLTPHHIPSNNSSHPHLSLETSGPQAYNGQRPRVNGKEPIPPSNHNYYPQTTETRLRDSRRRPVLPNSRLNPPFTSTPQGEINATSNGMPSHFSQRTSQRQISVDRFSRDRLPRPADRRNHVDHDMALQKRNLDQRSVQPDWPYAFPGSLTSSTSAYSLNSPNVLQPAIKTSAFPKPKSVRWSSEAENCSPNGMKNLFTTLDNIEADLVEAAGKQYIRTANADRPLKVPHPIDGNATVTDSSDHFTQSPSIVLRHPRGSLHPARTNGATDTNNASVITERGDTFAEGRSSVSAHNPSCRSTSQASRVADNSLDAPVYDWSSPTPGNPAYTQKSLPPQALAYQAPSMKSRTVAEGVNNLAFWRQEQNSSENVKIESVGRRQLGDCENKVVLRVHQADRTTKAVFIYQNTDASEVMLTLAAKNFLPVSTKFAIVEKVPSMKLERCFEDDENIQECILSWPLNSDNLVFFEEREDMYGILENPKDWLGNPFMDETGQIPHAMLMDILESDGASRLPAFKEHLYILEENNRWKRRFCVLRTSGLYASKRQDSDISDLVRVTVFGDHLHLYTTSGGWSKENTPTPFGFVLKPYSVTTMEPKLIRAFCAASECSLRVWCSLIRIILMGPSLLRNYQQRLAACALNYQVPDNLSCSGISFTSGGNTNASNASSLLDLVRQKYAREGAAALLESKHQQPTGILARIPAIVRARSFSHIQQRLQRPESLSFSQSSLKTADSFGELGGGVGGSASDLGFVSGRNDVGVGPRSKSLGELTSSEQRRLSGGDTGFGKRLGAFTLFNPLRWSRKDLKMKEDQHNQQQQARQGKQRYSRKGPAARRCDRSLNSLNCQSISPASSVFFLPSPSPTRSRPQSEELSATPSSLRPTSHNDTPDREVGTTAATTMGPWSPRIPVQRQHFLLPPQMYQHNL
nr:unnamed protein product [Spirometra erinaceieuropaei]